jgi:hypothetical protein
LCEPIRQFDPVSQQRLCGVNEDVVSKAFAVRRLKISIQSFAGRSNNDKPRFNQGVSAMLSPDVMPHLN